MNQQFRTQQRPVLSLLLKCKYCGKSFREEMAYYRTNSASCPHCGRDGEGRKI